jgi:hypothetical protein
VRRVRSNLAVHDGTLHYSLGKVAEIFVWYVPVHSLLKPRARAPSKRVAVPFRHGTIWRSNLILHIFRDDGQGGSHRLGYLAGTIPIAAFAAPIAAVAAPIAAFAA